MVRVRAVATVSAVDGVVADVDAEITAVAAAAVDVVAEVVDAAIEADGKWLGVLT